MIRSLLSFCAIIFATALCLSEPPKEHREIKIRFLDGRTGKPIKNDKPNIWYGDARDPINPSMDANGEVTLEVTDISATELRIAPNFYVDCRNRKGDKAADSTKYPLQEILAQGIVTANNCGNARLSGSPGVLVLFVRRPSLLEKMRE
jgi:hypothetical protein